MSFPRRPLAATMAMVALLGVVASASAKPPKPPDSTDSSTDQPAAITGRDALRQIVQTQCVVHWQQRRDPAPCERVFLPDPTNLDFGYAVLPDRKGAGHYLLIPTRTMAGIDGGELLDPDLPNYFAEAWHARDVIAKFVGHPVPRSAVGLAINNAHSRSQNQFHIHMECLRPDVYATLQRAAATTGDVWSPLMIDGSTYQAMRVMGDGLDGANVFELLAGLKPDVRHHLGDYTLVVAGMQFQSGPGFILLTGTGPTGELLLDASCVVAGAGG